MQNASTLLALLGHLHRGATNGVTKLFWHPAQAHRGMPNGWVKYAHVHPSSFDWEIRTRDSSDATLFTRGSFENYVTR